MDEATAKMAGNGLNILEFLLHRPTMRLESGTFGLPLPPSRYDPP